MQFFQSVQNSGLFRTCYNFIFLLHICNNFFCGLREGIFRLRQMKWCGTISGGFLANVVAVRFWTMWQNPVLSCGWLSGCSVGLVRERFAGKMGHIGMRIVWAGLKSYEWGRGGDPPSVWQFPSFVAFGFGGGRCPFCVGKNPDFRKRLLCL